MFSMAVLEKLCSEAFEGCHGWFLFIFMELEAWEVRVFDLFVYYLVDTFLAFPVVLLENLGSEASGACQIQPHWFS